MKKIFLFFLFCLLFSFENKAFVVKATLVMDSCSQITLLSGQIIEVKIINNFKNKIIYQDCGDEKGYNRTIFKSSIKDLKLRGTAKEIAELKNEKLINLPRRYILLMKKAIDNNQKGRIIGGNGKKELETLTIVALVLLILFFTLLILSDGFIVLRIGMRSFSALFIYFFPFISLLFSSIGYRKIEKNPDTLKGEILALIMMLASAATIAMFLLSLLYILLVLAFFGVI